MDSPSNRPRLGSFDQRLADFDTFSPGSAPPSQTHSLCKSPAVAPVPAPVIDDDDPDATLDDLREAVTTLEETERIARRVFGGVHPLTVGLEGDLRDARAALRARKTPPDSA